MSTVVDAGPVARRGQTRVMFLGGSLDHATRAVEADSLRPDRPAAETYRPWNSNPDAAPVYELLQCRSGPWAWWCYVLRGYSPPLSHLMDAKYNEFYRS